MTKWLSRMSIWPATPLVCGCPTSRAASTANCSTTTAKAVSDNTAASNLLSAYIHSVLANHCIELLSFPLEGRTLDDMPKRSGVLQPIPPVPPAKGIPPIPPLKPGAGPIKRFAKPAAAKLRQAIISRVLFTWPAVTNPMASKLGVVG